MLSRVEAVSAREPIEEVRVPESSGSRWSAFTGIFLDDPAPQAVAAPSVPVEAVPSPIATAPATAPAIVNPAPVGNSSRATTLSSSAPSSSAAPRRYNETEGGTSDAISRLNEFLARLGFNPEEFKAEFKPVEIKYPGNSYMYDMIQVEVNGEKVGFHAGSVRQDPRLAAANIAAMMGRPVFNFSEFA